MAYPALKCRLDPPKSWRPRGPLFPPKNITPVSYPPFFWGGLPLAKKKHGGKGFGLVVGSKNREIFLAFFRRAPPEPFLCPGSCHFLRWPPPLAGEKAPRFRGFPAHFPKFSSQAPLLYELFWHSKGQNFPKKPSLFIAQGF